MCADFKLYAARDVKTGKLVSDITNPKRKLWMRKSACEEAIRRAKRSRSWYDLELVTFSVTEEVTSKE